MRVRKTCLQAYINQMLTILGTVPQIKIKYVLCNISKSLNFFVKLYKTILKQIVWET